MAIKTVMAIKIVAIKTVMDCTNKYNIYIIYKGLRDYSLNASDMNPS